MASVSLWAHSTLTLISHQAKHDRDVNMANVKMCHMFLYAGPTGTHHYYCCPPPVNHQKCWCHRWFSERCNCRAGNSQPADGERGCLPHPGHHAGTLTLEHHSVALKLKRNFFMSCMCVFIIPLTDLRESQRGGGGRAHTFWRREEPGSQVPLWVVSVQEEVHKRLVLCCIRWRDRGQRKGCQGETRRGKLWCNFSIAVTEVTLNTVYYSLWKLFYCVWRSNGRLNSVQHQLNLLN